MQNFAQSLVETIRHPLVILDGRLQVQAVNRPFYRIFRTTRDETEGHHFFTLQEGSWDVPQLRHLLEEIIPNNDHFDDFDVEGDFSKLGKRRMLLNARRVEHSEGGAQVILLAIEDVTEQRQAQDDLSRLNVELESRILERTAELEAANQELEAFCYSVSHDLRSPLRAMEGFSEELLQRHAAGLDPRAQHFLTRIRAGSQRMATLIDDMLDLSRISRSEMLSGPVDLTALAVQTAEELQSQDVERAVRIAIQPNLRAHGDPRLLHLVLENLLGNAWKFTSRQPEAVIEFGSTVPGDAGPFFVRDNGAGFDMAYSEKLFGAFQRLHSDREFPGTGIGLATVQRIIHRHGGKTWAEGAINQGATFYFTVRPPCDPQPVCQSQ